MAWLRMALLIVRNVFRDRGELAIENLALRQQLAVFHGKKKRPRIRQLDRIFWIWLSRLWSNWRSALLIVQPDTVVRWHQQGFRLYWRWKSRSRRTGSAREIVAADSILVHSGLRNVVAKESQFRSDSRRAPEWIFPRHAPNQTADLGVYLRPPNESSTWESKKS
ncbi:MAG: hypothetical protein IH987_16325 [Planctomycetes bacterium]|nr:hypothetical protein [Planctomycetota bacterium]